MIKKKTIFGSVVGAALLGLVSFHPLANYYTTATLVEAKHYYDDHFHYLKHRDYSYSVNPSRFYNKTKKELPSWMKERIDKELSFFKKHPFSQRMVDQTYERVSQSYSMIRYRVVDGKLYRLMDGCHDQMSEMDEILRTLFIVMEKKGMEKFSHLDFMFSHSDGTPQYGDRRLAWVDRKNGTQAPVMTSAKRDDAPFLISVPDRLTTRNWHMLSKKYLALNRNYPWEKKKKMAAWRGQHGDFPPPCENAVEKCSRSPRWIISELSQKRPDLVDAGFNTANYPDSNVMQKISALMRPTLNKVKHIEYAYLPVLDGAMCTYPGYLWRLMSNCVTFKQEAGTSQWFYDALKPYEHYIPIKKDLSDLEEKILWAREHDEECKTMARNATEFVKNNVMIEDIYLYFYALLKEYEKCQDFTKNDLIQNIQSNEKWKLIYPYH